MIRPLSVALLLSAFGCITADDKAVRLEYTKDYRTNLCFAMYCPACKTSSPITNVPCTPEVERLIVK